jgi:hypothetical protein
MMWPLIFFFWQIPLTSTNAPKYILYGGDLQRLLDDNCTVAQLNEKAASNFFEFLPTVGSIYIYIHRFRVKRRERNTWPTVNLYSTYIYVWGEMQKLTSRQVFCFNENINTGILCSICPKGKGKGICRYRILVLD